MRASVRAHPEQMFLSLLEFFSEISQEIWREFCRIFSDSQRQSIFCKKFVTRKTKFRANFIQLKCQPKRFYQYLLMSIKYSSKTAPLEHQQSVDVGRVSADFLLTLHFASFKCRFPPFSAGFALSSCRFCALRAGFAQRGQRNILTFSALRI